jgi:hypothetical protein
MYALQRGIRTPHTHANFTTNVTYELEEKAAADPTVATRAAIESFIL